MENIDVAACASLPTQFAAVKLPKCLQGLTTPTTDPPTAKNAFKEPPSTPGEGAVFYAHRSERL